MGRTALVGTRGRTDYDLVDINVIRLLNSEGDRAADGFRWDGDPAKFFHGFACTFGGDTFRSDSVTPGEMTVTRILSFSRRSPSEIARTANFVAL